MRSILFKRTILLVIGLLIAVNWAVPASGGDSQSAEDAYSTLLVLTASISSQAGYGPIIYAWGFNPPVAGQQYEASAIRFNSSDLRVWTCGAWNGGDAIFVTMFNTDQPSGMVNAPNIKGLVYAQDKSDCSPSVLYNATDNKFRMYYECSPTLYQPNICFATSADGISWSLQKTILWNPHPANGGYGFGHPSAVLNADQSTTLLYVYDSTYYSNQCPGAHGIVWLLVLLPDGQTIWKQTPTNLPFAAKVKYYPAWRKYVATSAWTGSCTYPDGHWFGVFTSDDGITFTRAGQLLVPQVRNEQFGWDPGQLIADGQGWIQTPNTNLQALIGAGPDQFNAQTYMVDFGLNPH